MNKVFFKKKSNKKRLHKNNCTISLKINVIVYNLLTYRFITSNVTVAPATTTTFNWVTGSNGNAGVTVKV